MFSCCLILPWLCLTTSGQLCALYNSTLKLAADERKGIFHSLPAFRVFIFSQAALGSQALAGHKSNKASILLSLPSSCCPAARISCLYKTCFNPFTTDLTTTHTAQHHICKLRCANYWESTSDRITKSLNIHVVRLHIAGDTGNNYPGPRSAISMNIEQPQRAV